MNTVQLPQKALAYLLEDAASRDLDLRRRKVLLYILLDERYVDRPQLMVWVEALLGMNCFGADGFGRRAATAARVSITGDGLDARRR